MDLEETGKKYKICLNQISAKYRKKYKNQKKKEVR